MKDRRWNRKGFTLLYSLLLAAFSAYILLDAFVIPRTYANVGDSTAEVADTAKRAESEEEDEGGKTAGHHRSSTHSTNLGKTVTEGSSEESKIASTDAPSITLTEYRVNETTIYVADVAVSDPTDLKTAFANSTYGKNIKAATSEIAAANNAVLAVNGDFYGARNSGYVIRNGVLYRDVSAGNEDLVIYADGSFGIIQEDEITARELLSQGAMQVFSFGPALVVDGEIAVAQGEEVGQAKASNPRTAIGILDTGHYVVVVSDGRTDESAGLDLYELAQFMKDLGVSTAYNLDGGGSSTMVFNGTVVNHPTTGGNRIQERSVSDIVYFGNGT